MQRSGLYRPLWISTWQSEIGWLAQALSPTEFVGVATFYIGVDSIRGGEFPPSGPPSGTLVQLAAAVMEDGKQASAILETRGCLAVIGSG